MTAKVQCKEQAENETVNINHPAEEPGKGASNYAAPLHWFSDFYRKFGAELINLEHSLLIVSSQWVILSCSRDEISAPALGAGRDKKGELSAGCTYVGYTFLCSYPHSPTPPQALDSYTCTFLSPIDRSGVSFLSRLCTGTQTVSIPGMEKKLLAGCVASEGDWNFPPFSLCSTYSCYPSLCLVTLPVCLPQLPGPILRKRAGRAERKTT